MVTSVIKLVCLSLPTADPVDRDCEGEGMYLMAFTFVFFGDDFDLSCPNDPRKVATRPAAPSEG